MSKEDYPKYILSKRWLGKRIGFYEFLKKGKISKDCYACEANKANQVHHISYDRLGNESYMDLMMLCDDCHVILHQFDKDAEKATEKFLAWNGKSLKEYRELIHSKLMVKLWLSIPEAELLRDYILESGVEELGVVYEKLVRGIPIQQ